jgi:hypothetical protein
LEAVRRLKWLGLFTQETLRLNDLKVQFLGIPRDQVYAHSIIPSLFDLFDGVAPRGRNGIVEAELEPWTRELSPMLRR